MTLQEVSEVSGVALGTISRIERGEQDPQAATLGKLAKALEVEVADLLPKVRGLSIVEILSKSEAEFSVWAGGLESDELLELIEPLGREQRRRQTALERVKDAGERAELKQMYSAMAHISHLVMVATMQLHVTAKREAEATRQEMEIALAG